MSGALRFMFGAKTSEAASPYVLDHTRTTQTGASETVLGRQLLLDKAVQRRLEDERKQLEVGQKAKAALKGVHIQDSKSNTGLLGLLSRMVNKAADDFYSIKHLEPLIYDIRHHCSAVQWKGSPKLDLKTPSEPEEESKPGLGGSTYRKVCKEVQELLKQMTYRTSIRLIMQEDIIPVDGGEECIDQGVLRCFRDARVIAADMVLICTVLATYVLTPLTFLWGGTWNEDNPGGLGLLLVEFLLDLIYAGYLLLQLTVSFMHESRRVEVCMRRKILRRYLWNPIYWWKWASTTVYIWVFSLKAPLLLNSIKVVRLLHAVYLPDSMWLLREQNMVRRFTPMFLLLVASHWVACVLSCVGGYAAEIDDKGVEYFRTTFDGQKAVSDYFSAYLMAFVESIYMLTGAMDNPVAQDPNPRHQKFGSLLVVAVFGPVGIVVMALLISSILRALNLDHALEIRHEENKAFVSRALENLGIPPELRRRVFSLHYFQRMSHDYEAFGELFKRKNLSGPLESALRIYLYHESFLRSGYFQGKDTNYILEVVRCLEDRVFLPGDYVTRMGEVGTQMFFVARGALSVRIPHYQRERKHDIHYSFCVATILKGAYFGEVALIADCLRTAWVCAESYVIVSELRRAALERIWRYFPHERDLLINKITQDAVAHRKVAMRDIWRTAARKGRTVTGPKVLLPNDEEAGDADRSQDALLNGRCDQRDAPEEPRSEEASADEAAAPEPFGRIFEVRRPSLGRSAQVDELEARYHFAEEGCRLLEAIRLPKTPMFATADAAKLVSRTSDLCEALLSGFQELEVGLTTLTGRIEGLEKCQCTLEGSMGKLSTIVEGTHLDADDSGSAGALPASLPSSSTLDSNAASGARGSDTKPRTARSGGKRAGGADAAGNEPLLAVDESR